MSVGNFHFPARKRQDYDVGNFSTWYTTVSRDECFGIMEG